MTGECGRPPCAPHLALASRFVVTGFVRLSQTGVAVFAAVRDVQFMLELWLSKFTYLTVFNNLQL
jgi:hypothetical protein